MFKGQTYGQMTTRSCELVDKLQQNDYPIIRMKE